MVIVLLLYAVYSGTVQVPCRLMFFPCNLLFSNKIFYSESIVLMGSFQATNKCNIFRQSSYTCVQYIDILSILLIKPLCFHKVPIMLKTSKMSIQSHSLWGLFMTFPRLESLGIILAVYLNILSTLLLLFLKSEETIQLMLML